MEQAVSKTSMLKFCIMLRSSEWSNHEGCWQVILEGHTKAIKDPENVDTIIYLRVAAR